MKQNKKLLAACAAVVILAAAFFAVYSASRPDAQAGDKTITVEVVHKDASEKTFTYATDAEYLGEVLLAEGLVEGEEGPYGLYITAVDGEEAIYEVDQSYWALYEGGEYASVGVGELVIEDGDQFSLVYTIG